MALSIERIEDVEEITSDSQMRAAIARMIELVKSSPDPRSPAGQALLRLSRIINAYDRPVRGEDVQSLIDTGQFRVSYYSGPADTGPYVAACCRCGLLGRFLVPVTQVTCPACQRKPGSN